MDIPISFILARDNAVHHRNQAIAICNHKKFSSDLRADAFNEVQFFSKKAHEFNRMIDNWVMRVTGKPICGLCGETEGSIQRDAISGHLCQSCARDCYED